MEKVMYTARTGRRLLAFWIDSFFLGLCFVPIWIQLVGAYIRDQEMSVSWNWIVMGYLLRLLYKWMFLYFLGATVGKWLLGLRVVPRAHPADGLGLFQIFLRVLTDDLAFFFGQSLRALALLRLDRTHVSDWVAETRVVQFSKPQNSIKRHWILALVIIFFSFISQFQSVYELFQRLEWRAGQVIIRSL